MFIPDEVLVLFYWGRRQARPVGDIWGIAADLEDKREQRGEVVVEPQECTDLFRQDNDFSAPLTSFDWNPELTNLIGTSSIDTTCTIWDIEKGAVFTQLIAHDKEVYDIHFSR